MPRARRRLSTSSVSHRQGNKTDHRRRVLVHQQRRETFYAGFVGGAHLVVDLPRNDYARVADLNRQFDDLNLGFVDAAIVSLAETLGLSRVATTDRRHFAPLARALSLELVP